MWYIITGTLLLLDLLYTSQVNWTLSSSDVAIIQCLYILRKPLAPINVPNHASSVLQLFSSYDTHVLCHVLYCSMLLYCMLLYVILYFCSNSYSVHCSTKALISYYASWCLFGATSLHSTAVNLLCCPFSFYYYYHLYKSFLKNVYKSIYSTAVRASSSLKTVTSLGVHTSCHYLSYINILISVHCTWDFGPLNSLYYNILISVHCT